MASDRIFISYNSANQQIADSLYDYLEERGLSCWMAPRDIASGNYAGEITRALKASAIVIIVCSKESCQSEHVKNEVTLAFNNKKQIIPYCLEPNPFDDDMEYYLSAKQHIISGGIRRKDFEAIERMVREYLQMGQIPLPEVVNKGTSKWWIGALLLAVLVGAVFFFLRSKPAGDATSSELDSTGVIIAGESSAESIASLPGTLPAPTASFVFSGRLNNGYPEGYGKLTFHKARRIDMHDPEARLAKAEDYIIGDWKDGHLNYGEWYSADGKKKGFIQLGDYPETEADHSLGQCESY